MKDLEEVLNGLEQVEENWFSEDCNNQLSNALDDASIQSSPFFPFTNFNSLILDKLK